MEEEVKTEVSSEATATDTPATEEVATTAPVETTPAAAPNKGPNLVIILLVCLLIVAGVIIVILVTKKDDNKGDTTTTTTVAVQTKNVKITFSTDGGDEVDSMEVLEGESATLPVTTKEGYVFEGWYLEDKTTQVTNDYKFTEDTTLYAKWTEVTPETKTMKVTFDSKGGSKVSALTVTCTDNSATIKQFPKNPTKGGYTFRTWEDKNGKAILEGAKLTCDNLTLYAAWDKKDDTPTVQYTCPDGYTLKDTKCTIEGTVHEKCPSNTKADGNLCINTSDVNTGTRQCVEHTIAIDGKGHTWTGKGDYYMVGTSYASCAYYKWSEYTNKTDCDNAKDIYHNTVWVSQLNACYAGTAVGKYETVCSSDYQYYDSNQLSSKFGIHDNGKCLKKVAKEKYCDDGYSMTGGSCIKTVDAKVTE